MKIELIPPTPQGLQRLRARLRMRAHLCFAGSLALSGTSVALRLLTGKRGPLSERLWRGGAQLRSRALGLFSVSHPLAAALLRVRPPLREDDAGRPPPRPMN